MIQVHPTAIVSDLAKIGNGTTIGPYCVINEDVEIGENCEIKNGVVLDNGARIGNNVIIYSYATISSAPQDLKYANEKTYAYVGDDTVVREYATINRGTTSTGETRVGKNCLIMTYCHVAHDCVVGDNVIMSNVTQLAGHVTIEDNVGLGGNALIHQFVKVGKNSFVGAGIKVVKDVIPYSLTGKVPVKIEGINKIGLRRKGFSPETIKSIEQFYKDLLWSGKTTKQVFEEYEKMESVTEEVQYCLDFVKSSQRGIYR
jgi:UDP-N-acetylglucosamine acyltransferase